MTHSWILIVGLCNVGFLVIDSFVFHDIAVVTQMSPFKVFPHWMRSDYCFRVNIITLLRTIQLNSEGNVAVIQEKVMENVLDICKFWYDFYINAIWFHMEAFKAKLCRNLEACETMFAIFNN